MRRLLVPLALLCALVLPSAAHAARQQESQFQDDNRLVYATPDAAAATLDQLKALGVDRIRVSVFWAVVAPDHDSQTKPANFDASDPASYPADNWARYDTLVELAQARGIGVNFDVTSPAPLWATGESPDRPDIDTTYDPSAEEYGSFMRALGTRYSGTYVPTGASAPLPRVNYWSVWNEPNQGGWLTPQWAIDPRDPKRYIEAAPQLYRSLVDAAFAALQATGHAADTFLVGETAPKGLRTVRGQTRQMDALRFIRQLYCLDDHLQFERGTSAQLRGCPVNNPGPQFVAAHPGLFKMTGYSHHPYELTFSPHTPPAWKDWATIGNLPTLSRTLKRVFQRYGQPMPGGAKSQVPLYMTEFGYQTNPPDPTGVSLAKQAAYDNEAEYITWKNANVKTLTQFLLQDDKAQPGTPASQDATFQSGLTFADTGKRKPSYRAYAMPLFLPSATIRRGRKLRVWGGVRIADKTKKLPVTIQIRARGAKKWTKAGTTKTDGKRGYVYTTVRVRKTGAVRLLWIDGSGVKHYSRTTPVTVTRS